MSVPPRAVQLNEANAFLKDHPEVLYVDLLIADMNGVVRGKRIERVEDDPSVGADPVDGTGPTFWFNRVPEAKSTKVRIHLDVFGDVDTLVRRGATVLEVTEHWTVMADPEGNEFCAFAFPD